MSYWGIITWLRKAAHLLNVFMSHKTKGDSVVCRTSRSKILTQERAKSHFHLITTNRTDEIDGKLLGSKVTLLLSWSESESKIPWFFLPWNGHNSFHFQRMTKEIWKANHRISLWCGSWISKAMLRFCLSHQLDSAALRPFCAPLWHTARLFPYPSFLQNEPADAD